MTQFSIDFFLLKLAFDCQLMQKRNAQTNKRSQENKKVTSSTSSMGLKKTHTSKIKNKTYVVHCILLNSVLNIINVLLKKGKKLVTRVQLIKSLKNDLL